MRAVLDRVADAGAWGRSMTPGTALPPTGEPGGAGELGVPAASAAVANAWTRATGTLPDRFPILS